jgi:hypothetical protein
MAVSLKLMEYVASYAQSIIHEKIDRIVTAALQVVYQNADIKFCTNIDRTGDRMDAEFVIKIGDTPLPGPLLDSTGGGMLDVAAFTMRLAVVSILRVKGPIIMDEPFRHVDADAMVRLAAFVRRLSDDLGIQLIIVTHDTVLQNVADSVVHLVDRGVVKVTKEVK